MAESEFLPLVITDIIKWERVQLIFAGRIRNFDPDKTVFRLTDLENQRSCDLWDVQIKDDRFFIRVNITTVYGDRTFLPDGNWSLVACNKETGAIFPMESGEHLFSDEGFSDRFVLAPKNEKLGRFAREFTKGSFISYTIMPCVNDSGHLYLQVTYLHPQAPSAMRKCINLLKKWTRPFINSVLRGGFFSVFFLTGLFSRHKGNRIVFCSDSRAELSGNMKDVYDRLVERGLDKQFHIDFLLKESVKARRGIIDKFRAPHLLARADIVIIDDFNPTVKQLKFKPQVKVVQLWHACGAFKTVGFSRTGKKGGPFLTNDNHRVYTHAIASSSHVARFYCEAFGMLPDSVYPTGVPRTDMFFNDEYKLNTTAALYEAHPEFKGKKVILFAPTFRGNGAKSGHYPLHNLDMQAIAALCRRTDSVFIFKMHPFVKDIVYIPESLSDVLFDLSADREINDLLFITDLLITDYSSVIYEASILNIPMLFFAYDLEEYISSRDFYEPFESFVPGKIVRSLDELLSSIESGDFEQEKVEPFCNRNFEFRDGGSTDRVIDWIILGNKPDLK